MRFDAYAGNVFGGVACSEVAELVAIGAGARVERGRPRGRYTDVFDVKDGAEPVGWIGRDAILETAYFELKGARTPASAGAVRKWWPDRHTVSRGDVCDDYDDEGAFRRLVGVMDAAKDPRVKSDAITPRDGDRGETIYWGARTSRVLVRVYEAGKMKDRLHFGRPNWARAEVQVRPGKSREKALASTLPPLEFWGFSAWSRRAAEVLSHSEVGRFTEDKQPAHFDRTTLYLARAFKRHWEVMLEDFGDWQCVGRELQAVWAADEQAEQDMKAALSRAQPKAGQ